LENVDQDGWVGRQSSFRFPATDKHKTAILEVVRYPARTDLPLTVTLNGSAKTVDLKQEQIERIAIPLSATAETIVQLTTDRVYELSAADSRQRAFRIVNINLE
jgi:hypothetical protein